MADEKTGRPAHVKHPAQFKQSNQPGPDQDDQAPIKDPDASPRTLPDETPKVGSRDAPGG